MSALKKRGKDCPFCRRMRLLLIFTVIMASLLIFMVNQTGLGQG